MSRRRSTPISTRTRALRGKRVRAVAPLRRRNMQRRTHARSSAGGVAVEVSVVRAGNAVSAAEPRHDRRQTGARTTRSSGLGTATSLARGGVLLGSTISRTPSLRARVRPTPALRRSVLGGPSWSLRLRPGRAAEALRIVHVSSGRWGPRRSARKRVAARERPTARRAARDAIRRKSKRTSNPPRPCAKAQGARSAKARRPAPATGWLATLRPVRAARSRPERGANASRSEVTVIFPDPSTIRVVCRRSIPRARPSSPSRKGRP